jgi:hypothetical protein
MGKWSIAVNAGTAVDASATLVIKVLGTVPVAFDGGTAVVTDHAPGTVRYFSVDVPFGAEGWDVRMRDLTGPVPTMLVRRDFVTGPPGQGWLPWTDTQWPSGNQTGAGVDWTGYILNPAVPNGVPVPPRLVSGMGRPLQPGKYYVGVVNSSTTATIGYTIDSRGIGSGLTYPVTNLDYASGSANIVDLAPREARYFKVNIPANTPNWEVTLSTNAGGELELLARRGAIPDFAARVEGSVYVQFNDGCEVEMQKAGPERFALLPPAGADFILPGDYYLAVVGEGAAPSGITVGTGASSGVLKSDPLTVKHLGTANPSGTQELVELDSAQIMAYRFTVPAGTDSLEVRLDGVVGNPWISLVQGTKLPLPPGEYLPGSTPIGVYTKNEYGCVGGNPGLANTRILTVPNPAADEWSVIVRAGHDSATPYPYITASATLVVTALSTVPLAFDGGTYAITSQPPNTWRYFEVNVPAGAAGWDMRMRDVSGPIPAMLVRRDVLPFVPANNIPGFDPPGWQPWLSQSWTTKNQWMAGLDWTGYAQNGAGIPVPPRIVAATGRPLEPGTYFIGVYNNTNNLTNYTVDSRGIGTGMTYPITDVPFAGGSATITELPRREAQYFKVTVPPNTPSWEVTLGSTVGEVELLARLGAIPDFAALRDGSVYLPLPYGLQVEMQKAGPERYVLLPNTNTDLVAPGDYYLAVVSEGTNPSGTIIGTGSSSCALTSHGILNVQDLGTATVGGITEMSSLAGGQLKAYQFSVAPGTQSLEMRLENAVGFPAMSVVKGTRLPLAPLGTYPHSEYGYDGGTGGAQAASIHTVASPEPGLWSVIMRARNDPQSFSFPDASANLVIRSKPNLLLNFAEALNAGGGSHTDTRQAIDGEYNIYEVAVPSTVEGQAVLGWIIETEVTQGAVSLQVYKDFTNPASGIAIPMGVSVIVPPYLTFNEKWYVRVKATGLTNYKISSRPVTLERPVWQMPLPHNITFGDSGNDSDGNPLPGDRGVDLKEGHWHFYALDVPANNLGLLRTELQAISGNPDLYIREDGVPTINHNSNGPFGASLISRTMTGSTTSYGNWVPLKGTEERQLKPGRWYLGVRAGGVSNVRYRLIASTGKVNDLALNPVSATPENPSGITEHSLADNDWRYYRFFIPEAAPKNWIVTFSQQVGDVSMWVRDTIPPGQTTRNDDSPGYIASWTSDNKNQGPYKAEHTDAGSFTFKTPHLRPGSVYYVGIRSKVSATFSLSSDTSGGPIDVVSDLDFYNGTVTATVPANSSLVYRIPVPVEATRFKYTSTHSAGIQVRIEVGTLPGVLDAETQHYKSFGANSSRNQSLSATWWWVPNQFYYVRFVNNTPGDEPITFTLSGKNALTEDEDTDGLPDAWEKQYFNGTFYSGIDDPDNDGVNNATEFADGTIPNNSNSAKYTLTLTARNGSANAMPIQAKYDKGATVALSNDPDAGYSFVGWSGGPFRGEDFAVKATGTITIPTSGMWTFGTNAADGVRLFVNGVKIAEDPWTRDNGTDTYGKISLTAGVYPIELVAFEYRGGEGLELFAALGDFSAFNSSFRLVGDVANGGLAVQTTVGGSSVAGFTVRQVQSFSVPIYNLALADSLLAGTIPARESVTGLIDVVNFLTYDWSEGHFSDNAHFPVSAGIEDNPLSLTMNGNYTITSLNSIPLGTAVDAESLVWTTGSNAPWLGENDSTAFDTVDAAVSGPIADGQSSYLQTTVTGPGTITFRWKTSSHVGDKLYFYIDGGFREQISGETGWSNLKTYPVSGAGVHRLTWYYLKDGSISAGSDRGWIDQVTFTP